MPGLGEMNSEADPIAPVSALRDPRGVLPAGTRLRSYELLSVLGQGGFGIMMSAALGQLTAALVSGAGLPPEFVEQGLQESALSPARCQI